MSKTNLDQHFKELMNSVDPDLPALNPEEILAYHQGSMSEPEREAMRERLVFDKEGLSVLQDLDAFPDVDEAPEASVAGDAAWQAFQECLPEEVKVLPNSAGEPVKRPIPRWVWVNHALLAAACLILGFLGLQSHTQLKALELKALQDQLALDEADVTDINLAVVRSTIIEVAVRDKPVLLNIQIPNQWRKLPQYQIHLTGPSVDIQKTFAGSRENIAPILHRHNLGQSGHYQLAILGEQNGVFKELGSVILAIEL